MEKECIFCDIAHGKAPCDLLFENERIVVFKDIKPHCPTHLLIVPKKHIRSVNDLAEEDSGLLAELFYVAKEMAEKVGVDKKGYKLLFNVEKGGGQVIFHLHLHLLAK
ncbi:HIT domain-containing protein [Desulfobacterales bacterium HSG16]|nr:HIT domain-containing protein [Desulfobacterales bacterium HSG16]